MASEDRTPSGGKFARWAIALTLPLLLMAAALPWIRERSRATRGALPAALAHPVPDGAAESAAPAEPPRHPEAPSTAEIEAARAAQVEEGRLAQRHLDGATSFAPRQASTTADGERVAPFQGFGLSVESTPAGARVLVAGADVGETPIVTSVACEPGREVAVRVEKRGFRPEHRAVRCRADALLGLSVALAR